MKLSVVIPIFDEVSTVQRMVDAVGASPILDIWIIVTDDYSTDGTRELLRSEIEAQSDVVIHHDRNRGKGAAVWSGFAHVSDNTQRICSLDPARRIASDMGGPFSRWMPRRPPIAGVRRSEVEHPAYQ